LKNKKLIVPNINLKKFYRICAFQKTSLETVDLKEKSFRKYIKFRAHLFGGYIKAESYSIFIDEIRKAILILVKSKNVFEYQFNFDSF